MLSLTPPLSSTATWSLTCALTSRLWLSPGRSVIKQARRASVGWIESSLISADIFSHFDFGRYFLVGDRPGALQSDGLNRQGSKTPAEYFTTRNRLFDFGRYFLVGDQRGVPAIF